MQNPPPLVKPTEPETTIPPAPPQCGSFSPSTLVATSREEKPIVAGHVGDQVLAWNQTTGRTQERTVTAVFAHTDAVIEELTVDGETLETTPEHPFYTEEAGWVPAGSLWHGAHIVSAGGGWGTVEREVEQRRPELMYNLTVELAHHS